MRRSVWLSSGGTGTLGAADMGGSGSQRLIEAIFSAWSRLTSGTLMGRSAKASRSGRESDGSWSSPQAT